MFEEMKSVKAKFDVKHLISTEAIAIIPLNR